MIDADLSGVLADVDKLLGAYVVLGPHERVAIALWVVHTHAFEAADATRYRAITSAEKRSGKTRLLELLETLVARPWLTGRVTPAVLARKVDHDEPTLLLDESDAAFRDQRSTARRCAGSSTPVIGVAGVPRSASARVPGSPSATSPPSAPRQLQASDSSPAPSLIARYPSVCSGARSTRTSSGSASETLTLKRLRSASD